MMLLSSWKLKFFFFFRQTEFYSNENTPQKETCTGGRDTWKQGGRAAAKRVSHSQDGDEEGRKTMIGVGRSLGDQLAGGERGRDGARVRDDRTIGGWGRGSQRR